MMRIEKSPSSYSQGSEDGGISRAFRGVRGVTLPMAFLALSGCSGGNFEPPYKPQQDRSGAQTWSDVYESRRSFSEGKVVYVHPDDVSVEGVAVKIRSCARVEPRPINGYVRVTFGSTSVLDQEGNNLHFRNGGYSVSGSDLKQARENIPPSIGSDCKYSPELGRLN